MPLNIENIPRPIEIAQHTRLMLYYLRICRFRVIRIAAAGVYLTYRFFCGKWACPTFFVRGAICANLF